MLYAGFLTGNSDFLLVFCCKSVYLYGEASTQDYRKTVPQIRAGEYEGLAEKVLANLVTVNYSIAFVVSLNSKRIK